MKVVLATDGIYPYAMGGMQRHSRLLAEHLARSGKVELVVVHPHERTVFAEGTGIKERVVQPIDEDNTYLFELKRYSGRVAQVLREVKPDVILSQGFSVWRDIEQFSDKLIVHPHGLEMFQGITRKERLLGYPFRRALRGILRDSAHCVSLGGKLTTILQEQVKGSGCQVHVLPNAVDVPLTPLVYDLPVKESSDLTILFVGRFAFNKGIDLLMQLAKRLCDEGYGERIRFQLAGTGPMFEGFLKDHPGNVELLGRVEDDQLEGLYKKCDALMLPTRFEGMPTVVLEAMARSKPIIVTDVGATAELVNMHNGYLIPKDDPEALYQSIMSFHERSREVHRKMGHASYERAKELFSWPAVTERFLELFGSIAAR